MVGNWGGGQGHGCGGRGASGKLNTAFLHKVRDERFVFILCTLVCVWCTFVKSLRVQP